MISLINQIKVVTFLLKGFDDRFTPSISTLNPNLCSPFSDTSLPVTSVLRDPPTVCLSGVLRSVGGGAGVKVGGRYVVIRLLACPPLFP